MDSLDWETCRNEMAICRQLWYIYQQRETVNQDRVTKACFLHYKKG